MHVCQIRTIKYAIIVLNLSPLPIPVPFVIQLCSALPLGFFFMI